MFSLKVLFKRIGVFFVIVSLLTMVVFVSFNRPKQVKAEAITAVALGAGALIALVASYLTVGGVQITNNGGNETYFEGFMNDAIEDFKAYSPSGQAQIDAMFDSSGAFIGNAQDLSFVTSHSNAVGYWQIGKGLTSVLESFKSWFVQEHSLTSSPTVIDDPASSIELLSGSYSFFDGSIYSQQVSSSKARSYSSIVPYVPGTYVINLNEEFSLNITVGSNAQGLPARWDVVFNRYDVVVKSGYMQGNNLSTSVPVSDQTKLVFGSADNLLYLCKLSSWYANNPSGQWGVFDRISLDITMDFELVDMSLDGALTDGYQDFQDALDQDLDQEQDNEDAVIQVGVNDLPAVLSPDQVVPWILGDVVANDLDTTYEGIYENQKTAEDDKDDEKEFVPEVPEGWVVVDGLEDFFPFCIPFDFYALLDYFDAEPQAPRIEWEMGFGGVFDSETVILDFEDWEPAARIFRIIVVIGFLVFLILKTRDLIRG